MADTPKVYVICDLNCKFEGMTKEQIYTAIVQAVNEGTIGDIDTGFVQTIKTINGKALKFFVGEQHEYELLSEKDREGLFAIITNDMDKYSILTAIETLQKSVNEMPEKIEKVVTDFEDGKRKVHTAKYAECITPAARAIEEITATGIYLAIGYYVSTSDRASFYISKIIAITNLNLDVYPDGHEIENDIIYDGLAKKIRFVKTEPAWNRTLYIYKIGNIGNEQEEEVITGIKFTVNGVEYNCDKGMTWAEWVASDYNTKPYYVTNGHISVSSSQIAGVPMTIIDNAIPTDLIVGGMSYVHTTTTYTPSGGATSNPFTINGVKYYSPSASSTTWGDWINSSYNTGGFFADNGGYGYVAKTWNSEYDTGTVVAEPEGDTPVFRDNYIVAGDTYKLINV